MRFYCDCMAKGLRHSTSPTGATFTTVFGMTLAVLMIGVMAATFIVSQGIARRVQECAGLNVSIANNVTLNQQDCINCLIDALPSVSRTRVISRTEALQQWKQETGEDLMELMGENPLNATIKVQVKASWASSDSLMAIKEHIETMPGVVDVSTTSLDIDNIVTNTRRLLTFMGVFTLVILVIAVALITSMVKLLTYSQRHIIHTMTLVGADTWFIVRPFAHHGAVMGLVAGVIAGAMLVGVRWMLNDTHDSMLQAVAQCLGWSDTGFVATLMIASAIVVGSTTAAIAARQYTRSTHDELYG